MAVGRWDHQGINRLHCSRSQAAAEQRALLNKDIFNVKKRERRKQRRRGWAASEYVLGLGRGVWPASLHGEHGRRNLVGSSEMGGRADAPQGVPL